MYQIHAWDAQTPPEVWLVTMRDFVRAGKILTIGVRVACACELVDTSRVFACPTLVDSRSELSSLSVPAFVTLLLVWWQW